MAPAKIEIFLNVLWTHLTIIILRNLDIQVVHDPVHILGHSGVDSRVALHRTSVTVRDNSHDEHVPSRVQSGVLDPCKHHQRTT